MDDRRTKHEVFETLSLFPADAEDYAARLTGGAVIAAAAASQGAALFLAGSAFLYGFGNASLRHLQAYGRPWLR